MNSLLFKENILLRILYLFIPLINSTQYSFAQPIDSLELKTAEHHPMKYYLSLPGNWSLKEKWPIVIVIEAAEKEFKKNAERFIQARQIMPFIIIAPFITTNYPLV